MAPNKLILLLSGGIDSTACLEYYRSKGDSEIVCLFVDYRQAAVDLERSAARQVASYYNAKLLEVSFAGTRGFGAGYIKGRNAMLMAAALVEVDTTCGLIAIGLHSGTRYVDSTPHFVSAFQAIVDCYSDGSIQIDAPFLSWHKGDILAFCEEREVPLRLTYSCEAGERPPCGRCHSCIDREPIDRNG